MRIYLAELSYGNPAITAFEVEEKSKTYKVISSVAIVGYSIWDKSINKGDPRIHVSLSGAIFSLEKQAKEYMDVREEDFHRAVETWKQIHDVADATRAEPEKVSKIIEEMTAGA